jgi:hypothetical protein
MAVAEKPREKALPNKSSSARLFYCKRILRKPKSRERVGELSNHIEMKNYYVYQNWRADGMKYTVHVNTCGHCQNGAGARHNAVVGLNGVWIGPFAQFQLTEEYRLRMNIPIDQWDTCNVCNPA